MILWFSGYIVHGQLVCGTYVNLAILGFSRNLAANSGSGWSFVVPENVGGDRYTDQVEHDGFDECYVVWFVVAGEGRKLLYRLSYCM